METGGPPKNLDFKPLRRAYCPFLRKNVGDTKVQFLVNWLPFYSKEQYDAGSFMERIGYKCSLSGTETCKNCLGDVFKERLSKLGFELYEHKVKNSG